MKIYLSWSGELGRRAAGALRAAIRQLIPTVEVMSPGSDITEGVRWIDLTRHAIEESELALVCITKDSRDSPWLFYELGVMVGIDSIVVPWLVDIEYSELEGPLAQFQAIRSDAQSFRRLVKLICRDQPTLPVPPSVIERWALDIETEMRQLVGSAQRKREVRGREEWLALITEAASDRNRDQLQSLRDEAEADKVSDQHVLHALLKAYFELRDFQGLIESFERFQTRIGQDPEALIPYAWALLRTGEHARVIEVLDEVRRSDSTETRSGSTEAEIMALLGRAYKDQWRERTDQGNLSAAEESLRRSAEIYTEGFRRDPNHYYLGLNAVQLLHLLGDESSVSLRDELLPSVQSALESAVAESGGDFWATASLLELAAVRGSQTDALRLVELLLSKVDFQWQVDTIVQNLRLLSQARGFGGKTPEWLSKIVERLTEAVVL